ncbi:hypothetical protein FSW04_13705 [Baekduia soli]|uniref:Uncharacterized protein n=1 Tax=Baekduia soli TaxID=496014 RepID=A0A5B8U5W8_9ACTN|nr:hypothetical protein FSW04_13705 [Baekduia soli]
MRDTPAPRAARIAIAVLVTSSGRPPERVRLKFQPPPPRAPRSTRTVEADGPACSARIASMPSVWSKIVAP